MMTPVIMNHVLQMTPDQIAEQYVQTGNIELWEGNNSPILDKTTPDIGEHFNLKWVEFVRDGIDKAKLVIVPTTSDGKKMYFNGQICYAETHGLSKGMAFKWVLCRNKYKYRLLPLIAEIMNDTDLLVAYSNYDADDREHWKYKWRVVPLECSYREERELVTIIRWILDPSTT